MAAKKTTTTATKKKAASAKKPPLDEAATPAATPGRLATAIATPALTKALEGWSRTRHPRFAAIVDALAAREAPRPIVADGRKRTDLEAWTALEAAGDPYDFPRLMATLAKAQSPDAKERVERMASRNDPRVVPSLLAIASEPPYTAGTSKKFWQAVVAALEASRDPRARDGMMDLSKRYKAINDTEMGAWVASAMFRAAGKIVDPTLDAKTEKALEALEIEVLGAIAKAAPKPKRGPSLDEAFADVVKDLADDAPRLVFADILTDRGDPRGEFILLQVDRAAGRGTPERSDVERTKYIRKDILTTWKAPLSTAADKVTFDRGFPYRVALAKKGLATVLDAPEWGTVRELSQLLYAPVKALLTFLDSDAVRNVTSLDALDARLLGKLKRPSFAATHVCLLSEDLGPEHVARFPNLTNLELEGDSPRARALFAAASKLTHVDLDEPLATDSAELFADNPRLESLRLRGSSSHDLDPARFAGLGIRHLDVGVDFGRAIPWLEAIPSLTALDIHVEDRGWEWVPKIFAAAPKLERLGIHRWRGSLRADFVRRADGLDLVFPEADQWAGFEEEVSEMAPQMIGLGVRSMVLFPEKPRHAQEPTAEEKVAKIRDAWAAVPFEFRVNL